MCTRKIRAAGLQRVYEQGPAGLIPVRVLLFSPGAV